MLVDKPQGWTSHDVVARLRRMFGTKRVGHAGTLDPMATGLLIVGVNRGTKLLTYFVGLSKEYSATIRLGISTVTEDAEGEVTEIAPRAAVSALGESGVDAAIASFRGVISQVPSSVSAIKVNGKRSYARVRAGEDVTLAPRTVTISQFDRASDLRRAEVPVAAMVNRTDGTADSGATVVDVDVVVACSSGTYVRALARDVGARLGVGGHLIALRRHTVGPFDVADASVLPRRDEEWTVSEELRFPLQSLADSARAVFPARELTQAETVDLSHGRRIAASESDGVVAAIGVSGQLSALISNRDGEAKPVLVVPPVDGNQA